MININEYTLKELEEYIENLEEKKFHAKQIFKWLHKEQVESFDDMTDISKSLREKLKKQCEIVKLQVIEVQKSKDGTHKFLLSLSDSNAIESVFMKYNHGNTICVSTQVGCKMGCKFCASTKEGYKRNLLASEIEGQIVAIEKYMKEKISNVVYMGIGEPLDNYDNVVKSIRQINNPMGLGIGARHISLSTSGIVPNIYKLADEKIQATLSISLHATTDKKRKEIMPITNKYGTKELLEACRYYIMQTGRRISFEYALIHGVNDSKNDAIELAKLLRGMIAHVNLIPVNEIKEKEYTKSKEESIKQFMTTLNSMGIITTVRRELGKDIDAACGQLRQRYLK
ncbi:MAG: 23S rRNA (adenine(2503)-C(2))-methyltransferase RlmN [Clostridia bacterium]|nr:23S rRNA (adenine(2503)-C(2))-methyltransferase RlmN [Clostridia bacterium]MDD4376070.1 23S rRNA (adenine(2503)-C(2))-methyltransferase RlmN [Clostridia bacterium]